MAKIFPLEQATIDFTASQHGRAEAYIIKLINQMDPKLTKDWRFYYSYSFKSQSVLNNYKKYKDCEIDFLCLLPNLGIFVFEIKGGKIYKEGHDYISVDFSGTAHHIKNPYEQAKSNYYALSENLKEINFGTRKLTLSGVVGDHLVGFPDIDKIDFDDVLKTNYNTFIKGNDLYKFFINAAKETKNSRTGFVPTLEDIEKIHLALAKENFTSRYDINKYLDTVNVRVTMLTEEQKTVLIGLLDNKRCLIYGKAGTGKTVLSEMLFNNYLEKNRDVIYFSYNDFNAEKVSDNLKYRVLNNNSKAVPFLRYIVEEYRLLSGKEPILDSNNSFDFGAMINYLLDQTNRKEFKKYSAVIIDEAQDITKGFGGDDETNVLLFLDAITVGGIKDGEMFIFYDDDQNINRVTRPFYKDKTIDDARFSKFRLMKNCRNVEEISEVVDLFKEGKALQNLKNTNIKITNFKNINNLVEGAIDKMRELLKKGVNENAITVLHTSNKNILPKIEDLFAKSGLEIKKYNLNNSKKYITYTTNRKFKGLESNIIIYLRCENKGKNINFNHQTQCKNIDYVTISRARTLCFVFNLVEN